MRNIFFLFFLCVAMAISAKSERIPYYRSFVYWIQGEDTVYVDNSSLLLESLSPDGTVAVRVRHEDWESGVNSKSIASLAPWHAVMSQRRGIRAIISQGRSNTDAMMPMKSVVGMMQAANSVRTLSAMADKREMNLSSEYMIENTGESEIIVNDLNRGLVWYVPSGSYLLLNMGSLPQACHLRIADTDPQNPNIKYVIVGSASYTLKLTVAYEDEDCWIYLLNEESRGKNETVLDFSRMLGDPDDVFRTLYIRRDKRTFQEIPMPEKEVFAVIKEAKTEAKAAKARQKGKKK